MLYRGKRVRERGRLPKGKFPKKGGRRLVSGLLALVLCLTLVPVIYADTVVTVTSWYAAGAFEENTLYWWITTMRTECVPGRIRISRRCGSGSTTGNGLS